MFPRWLSWLFVLFLGYVIVTGNRGVTQRDGEPDKAAREEHIASTYPSMHALIDGDRWRRAIDPTYQPATNPCAHPPRTEGRFGSYVILEQSGAGESARCGDTVRLALTQWSADGTARDALSVTLTLGEQPGLDALLIGMTEGETRRLAFVVPNEGYPAVPELSPGLTTLSLTRVAE